MDTKEAYKQILISIHALCEEGDADTTDKSKQRMEFLSTPSARRATQTVVLPAVEGVISIHALCEEGDTMSGFKSTTSLISIHALCEEGDACENHRTRPECYFYPRPLRGGRPRILPRSQTVKYFYPRPLRGGRHDPPGQRGRCKQFLSTPSARRATAKTETKSLFSNKLYNILHEFRRALIYNGSKSYPNHAK